MPSSPAPLNELQTHAQFNALWAGDSKAWQTLIDGNSHWALRLAAAQSEESGMPVDRLREAAMIGLAKAIDHFSDSSLAFQPGANLQGGYAIWWVRIELMRLTERAGEAE